MKLQSITTKAVKHDVANFLVEIFLLGKYGKLEPYCWRKGHSMFKEWPKLLSVFKRLIKTHSIKAEQLAWYIYKYEPKEIDSESFGLFVWKVRKLFKTQTLQHINKVYLARYEDQKLGYSHTFDKKYADINNSINKPKNLVDVLKSLETIDEQG